MSLWFFSRGDRQTRWQTFTGRLHMLRSQWHDISSKQDFLEGPVAVEGRRTSAEKCCPSFNSATEPKQKPHPFCLITPLCSMCSTYPPKPIYQRNDRLSMCWQAARLSEQPVWHVCFPASNTNSTCSGVLTARSGPPTVQLDSNWTALTVRAQTHIVKWHSERGMLQLDGVQCWTVLWPWQSTMRAVQNFGL